MRYMRALLAFLRCHAYTPAPEWSKEDAGELLQFMTSGTGKRFSALLRNYVSRQDSTAVTGHSADLDYRCGYAAGFKGAVGAIEAMLPPRKTFETETPDSSSDLDHLSP